MAEKAKAPAGKNGTAPAKAPAGKNGTAPAKAPAGKAPMKKEAGREEKKLESLNREEPKSKEQERLLKMPAEELAKAIRKLLLEDMVDGEGGL